MMEKSENPIVKSLNKPTRKLVAILFADIVGYTALMQKGENKALKILNKFESVMESYVPEYNGEIIKCYGDGCLVLFNSAVNAVKCSKRIQEALQEDVIVPLRIGIHIGDIIIKGNDVFGDGVNIASRVESMGVPGAILLSDLVYDKVKNQEQFDFKLMGGYHFKNVDQSMEVYCLANNGMVIPKKEELKGKVQNEKKWNSNNAKVLILIIIALIITLLATCSFLTNSKIKQETNLIDASKSLLNKNIAVLVFKNETDIEEINSIGLMASDWITKNLIEINKGKVINSANVKDHMALAESGSTKQFAKETGADIMITGRYYKLDDEIIIEANIVDAYTGNVLKSHSIKENQNAKIDLVHIITQQLIGYWATRDHKRYARKPPKYDAYKLFLEAESIWATDHEKAEKLLLQSYELDSTFFVPLLKLFPLYINNGNNEKRDSLLQYLEDKDTNFSSFENLRYEAIKAAVAGKLEKAASIYGQMADYDPSLSAYMAAMYNIQLFRLEEAIEYLRIDMNLPGKKDDWISQQSCAYLLQILLEQDKYVDIIHIVDSLEYTIIDATIAGSYLTSLLMTGQRDKFDTYYSMYDSKILMPNNSTMLSMICNHLFLRNNSEILSEFLTIYKREISREKDGMYINFMKGNMFYMNGEYKIAAEYFQKENFNGISDYRISCLVKAGNIKEAERLINKIKQSKDTNKLSHKHYILAQYYTAIGNIDLAITHIKKAIQLAYPYTISNYGEDLLLRELKSQINYVELFTNKTIQFES